MKPTLILFALISLAAVLLGACSPVPTQPPFPDPGSSVPPEVTQVVQEPLFTGDTPTPLPTKDQSPPGTPIVKGADPFPGWATYLNSSYDFAFRYPDAYLVEESPNQARLTRPGAELRVSFRGSGEAMELPHDLPYEGELEDGAETQFFGQAVREVRHLVNGQVMAVEYTSAGSAAAEGELPGLKLIYAIQLFSLQSDAPLSEELLAETRLLLSSFEPWTNN